MKMPKNKTATTTLIALFLTVAIAASLALPVANAHTPSWTIQTYAYVVASPNPVGVGQSVFLVAWIHGAPHTAAGLAGDRWRGFTITITKPNGDIEKLGPWDSDPVGNVFTSYTPDQVGTYKIEFKYPGQVLSRTGPTGLVGANSDYINDTFLASSATTYLTVQETQVEKIPEYPLPTEYWTRPIEGQNSAWAKVTSNWLGGAHQGGYNRWQRSGVAPNSAHVMWKRPIEMGGIVGGDTQIPGVGFYSGGSYEGRFTNAMIMYGRLYYADPLGHSATGGGYTCLDLRTGEVIWHRDDLAYTIGNTSTGAPNTILVPSFGQLFNYESQNQHGVVGGALWVATGTTWSAFDPYTGKFMFNLTNVPTGTEVYTSKGEIVRYVFSYSTTRRSGWLALWNNTCQNVGLELVDPYGGVGTNAYQWRPNGKVVDMSNAYSWNVTINADLSGLSAPAIVQVLPGDIILGRSSAIAAGVGDKYTPNPYTIWAISDKPGSRGQLLWIKNYTAPPNDLTRRIHALPIDTVNRVFVMIEVETMSYIGYDLDTGNQLWGPVSGATKAYSYYGGGEGGGTRCKIAYGNIYAEGYGGELICYSGKTGKVLWVYNNTNSGDETPWGNYPIFIGAIADGKVYAFNNEHSPNYPLYKGERVRCINATTGEEIWSLLSWAGQTGGPGTATMITAEGYLTYYSYYDNCIYCIGKGPSATTVTASPKVSVHGNKVLIEGTVMDIAAGTKQNEQAARFPNGVPAVSDESMSAWMEYVYMQKPCPTNVKGVQVTLDTLDPNGNFVHIGTATSDMSGNFGHAFVPEVPGKYTIIATFAGSESYYPSYAETFIYVDEAPPATEPPAYPQPIDPTMTIVAATIAIIIAVAIVGILLLRKK
ncbi:MAG: PQQ-binding-like beta-propeller repeat protein [Candidatus Bathyarchaeota archaeon]|nr:PQQ-binding-like beta-propeller repeat protein [Candidatus Bathyarchaeota archaeon]